MSEKIKAGTMVWVRDVGKDWRSNTKEYLGLQHEGGHSVWSSVSKTHVSTWDEVTADNPLPQQPDFIPEGMEMWEERGKYDTYVFYSDGVGSFRTKNLPEKRFHAFAVKSASGKVHLMNSPVWYTRKDNGLLLNERIDGYELRAEVLGAVMVKGEE